MGLASIPRTRILPMEGMRGYAVLLVFLVHHHNLFGSRLPAGGMLAQLSQFGHDIGHSGVDVFFVLSGFLIYGQLIERRIGYVDFLRRRARRIYPAFLAIFAAYVLLSHLVPSASKMPHTTMGELVYIVENLFFLPGIFAITPLITVAWSLSYEFLFYLTIPLVISLAGLRSWSRVSRGRLFAGLSLFHWCGFLLHWLPDIRLSMFVAGMLLYEMSPTATLKLSHAGEAAALGVYTVVLFAFAGLRAVPLAFLFLWFAIPPLVLYGMSFGGLLNAVFSLGPLRWLGNMSYTFFLFHALSLNAVAAAMRISGIQVPVVAFPLLLALNLTGSLAGSYVLFLLVERRFSLAGTSRRKYVTGDLATAVTT